MHLEYADLVGRAEPVLHGAQNAELMSALAFEIEHRVDHMLDNPRTSDLAFFGDMPNQASVCTNR